MARQTTENHTTTNSDFIDWFQTWLKERSRYQCILIINLNEPLKADEEISVLVLPAEDSRDVNGCFDDPRYRQRGYEIPTYLFKEKLTKDTAACLQTNLSIIRDLQGIDFTDGLAYMVQIFLLTVDFLRAKRYGAKSVLFGPCWGEILDSSNSKNGSGVRLKDKEKATIQRLQPFPSHPKFKIETLLNYWNLRGGRLAKGVIKSPNGQPGIPNYRIIPPTWLHYEQLKELYGDKLESLKIPILINSSYKPLVESMVNCYDTHAQSHIPMKIMVGAPATQNFQPAEKADQNLFQRQGDVWTISYQGTPVHLKDMKGLHYLAHLLSNPGQSMTPPHLIALVDSPTASPGKGQTNPQELENETLNIQGGNDGDEILDKKAVRDYKGRLDDLKQEIEEAEANNDQGTLEKLSEEKQWLLEQLRRVTGLGGKIRTFANPDTKVIKAVSNTIRNSLKTIQKEHPVLATHLRRALRLGVFCVYQPECPTPWIV